jgi:hypothetical protein
MVTKFTHKSHFIFQNTGSCCELWSYLRIHFCIFFRCQERNTSIMHVSSVDFSSGRTVFAYRTLYINVRHEYQWLQARVRYIHNAGYQFARGSQPMVPPLASELDMAKICSIFMCQIHSLSCCREFRWGLSSWAGNENYMESVRRFCFRF